MDIKEKTSIQSLKARGKAIPMDDDQRHLWQEEFNALPAMIALGSKLDISDETIIKVVLPEILPHHLGGLGSAYVNGRALTIMLMPLVAFDDAGFRIGMGGGYYDRFLGNLPTQLRPRLIGIAHEVQHCRHPLVGGPWDVPLDDVIK